jgi:hypothetical protein
MKKEIDIMTENLNGNPEETNPETPTPVAPTAAIVTALPADPVTAKLQELNVEADVIAKIITDLGAATVEDLAGLTEPDLLSCGMKKLPARNLLKALVPAAAAPAASAGLASPRVVTVAAVRLQDVPQQSNWLSSLCAIQPQRIQPLTVVTGIKAAMADVYGYFTLSKKMMNMLRKAADEVGESVPELFFELQNLSQARRYGALVAWMQGKGSACTVEERNRFLGRMHEKFWDALDVFYAELDAWRRGRRESQDVGEALASAMSGDLQIYDATLVRNAALALGDTINRTFSGTGVYAATALALDNDKLQKVLAEMDFRQFGVQSREHLLMQLGCAVPAEIMAAETTIAKFAWNAMVVKDQAAGGMEEQKFLIELASIGTSRPWNQIKALAANRKKDRPAGLTGIGRGRSAADDPDDDPDEV